jgi:hypothetical protein
MRYQGRGAETRFCRITPLLDTQAVPDLPAMGYFSESDFVGVSLLAYPDQQ